MSFPWIKTGEWPTNKMSYFFQRLHFAAGKIDKLIAKARADSVDRERAKFEKKYKRGEL